MVSDAKLLSNEPLTNGYNSLYIDSLMKEKKEVKKSYLSEVMDFYFAPKLRSVFTVFFLISYGFFVLYYIDNVFLAIHYVLYIIIGSNVLQNTSHLFWGLSFILTLMLPFSISIYSIFLLFDVWQKTDWSKYIKIIITALFIILGLITISVMDDAARKVAQHPELSSFIEDVNLTGRI